MANLTADEIVTQKHKRNFIQFGGARPNNPARYAGQDAQYLAIGGVTVNDTGDISPIYVPDPIRPGQYRLVGRSVTAPDLAQATLKMHERHGSIPVQLGRIGCAFNAYEVTGNCRDLSDFLAGWSDYVLIYSGALVTSRDLGDRTQWDGDDAIEDSLSLTLADVYAIGALSFGTTAEAQIDREVVDVVFGSGLQCGDCGPADDGTNRIYSVTKASGAGSPGLPAEVQYTLDGGATWSEATITGIGANENPIGIDIVGDKLVVISHDAGPGGGLYYATLNSIGAPGAFTKVTTGFVAGKYPNDIYVASPREVYFAADGGYIYKSTDIAGGVTALSAGDATTQNLIRIHGANETIVAVGAGMTVVKSANRGETWATTTTAPSATGNGTAVSVLDQHRVWVGTSSGRLAYTLDGGETWTEKTFSGSGAGTVYDIVFPTDDVGYVSHSTATPTARVFATWDGGADWSNASPRILNTPTANRFNRLATPRNVDSTTASNTVAVAGLSGGGTDGILLQGVASVL
jgi:photosystem II stability/assembly factor-like uncharacterized protein